MRKINISILLGLLLILTSFNSLNRQYRLQTIVIDAGHGGKDPGARGKFSWEKDIALSISLELGRKYTQRKCTLHEERRQILDTIPQVRDCQ